MIDHATASAPAHLAEKLRCLRSQLTSVIRGKHDAIDHLLIALVAGGSVLLEDVPGVGKTTLAKALAASVDLQLQRVQCTPDLLPADIFGFSVFNPQAGTFDFRPGPIFSNLLLVDEINRASPRTQSALLEAMAESQVTIEGRRHVLEAPFLVLATQNPAGFQGTFPLPESQLDRFLFQLSLDYPDAESEVEMLFDQQVSHPVDALAPVLTREDVLACQSLARRVTVERSVAEYMVEIVRLTRGDSRLQLGCSPRGTLKLFRAAQAAALVAGREFVLPDDVQRVAGAVLRHRVVVGRNADARRQGVSEIVAEIVEQVSVPV